MRRGIDSLHMLLFLHGALGVIIIAALTYVAGGRRPQFRFALIVTLLLIAAFFAFLPFLPAFHPAVLDVTGKKIFL